eukprot:TRINITY_DN1182_c0_g1_i7.p1 TRINITY_DN1182_c0_g1~~TRINITY_DN1182_c0_g1_i7.p1  ORF type:complete len:123 (-),score=11.70 TRINITY_DN1182_c0_g1_i7:86-454(-)
MIRRPPRSTLSSSSAASDVYKRQVSTQSTGVAEKRSVMVYSVDYSWNSAYGPENRCAFAPAKTGLEDWISKANTRFRVLEQPDKDSSMKPSSDLKFGTILKKPCSYVQTTSDAIGDPFSGNL